MTTTARLLTEAETLQAAVVLICVPINRVELAKRDELIGCCMIVQSLEILEPSIRRWREVSGAFARRRLPLLPAPEFRRSGSAALLH
jgi:hypothetical protein